jgi:ABC-type transport system involved in multi-copper enzyme maturation permease subunit
LRWPAVRTPAWPLLGKELVEASARRRTYVLRAVLALVLLLAFSLEYASVSRWSDSLMGMLGRGRELCDSLVASLFVGTAVVLPAISAGTVTREKEQGSLVLLLLTPLTAWDLVLQKWLSRVAAMLALLVPALPLMAVAYAYGGFSVGYIAYGIAVLLLETLQLSALSLAISCWCRGTTSAFFLSYAVTAAMYPGYAILQEMVNHHSPFPELLQVCPLIAYIQYSEHPANGLGEALLGLVTPTVLTLLCLFAARLVIVRRAALEGGNRLLRAFLSIDRTLEHVEGRFGRRFRRQLPGERPVAWREVHRRSFANLRYLLRIFLPLALVVVGIFQLLGDHVDREEWLFTWFSLFGLAVLATLVQGAGLVSAERAQQTLPVLLTTPLGAREILAQKLVGMRRMQIAMSVLLALPLLGVLLSHPVSAYEERQLVGIASTLLLLPVFGWLAVWIGLRARTHLRAVVQAVVAAAVWSAGIPLLIGSALSILDHIRSDDPWCLLFLTSPGAYVVLAASDELRHLFGGPWLPAILALGAYAVCCLAVRIHCRSAAEALLGREREEL